MLVKTGQAFSKKQKKNLKNVCNKHCKMDTK